MSDPTSTFFADLAARGHVPMLGGTSGTLRFDLEHGKRVDHWYVTIHRGDVSVTRDRGDADCVVAGSRELFDRMASGTANSMAAALRGLVKPAGDLRLIIQFQRLFPGPPGSVVERTEAGYARRPS
jgi:hypothetical protein